jgi:hypothetical protein
MRDLAFDTLLDPNGLILVVDPRDIAYGPLGLINAATQLHCLPIFWKQADEVLKEKGAFS